MLTLHSYLIGSKEINIFTTALQYQSMEHKRFIVTSEPSPTQSFDASTIKKLTGGETVTSRRAHGVNHTIYIKGTFATQCNTMPLINKVDGGITRRVAVVDFTAKFTDPDTDLQDPAYRSNLRSAFFMVLKEYWRSYQDRRERLQIPPIVEGVTTTCLNRTEYIMPWFRDNFVRDDDTRNVISLDETYKEYKLIQNDEGSNVPTSVDFYKCIKNVHLTDYKIVDKRAIKYVDEIERTGEMRSVLVGFKRKHM